MAERPKRRKYKDNPYTLNYIESKNIYVVSFKDIKGHLQNVEVNKEVYQAFDRFELDDLSEMNEYDNHIEHSEIFENTLEVRAKDKPMSLEDSIIQKSTFEELKRAIGMLPEVQKRRIKKYYFDDKTLEEIAKEEKCSKVAIKYSIDNAIKNISKKIKI
ncbi:MAG: sigma-70 family RNA polymerase sigma factor [Bacilli bacterium]|nr:sigma-70 family RNA polymerase sigma factor [Bacilli bacterium]